MRIFGGVAVLSLFCMLWLAAPLTARAQPAESLRSAASTQPDAVHQAGNAGAPAQLESYQLPPDKLKKAEALYRTRMLTFVLGTVYGIVLLVLLLNFRIGARFRNWAEQASSRRFVQVIIFAPLLLLTMDALSLPISIYRQHLAVSYELSVQSWGSWFWDWAKNEIIGTVIATLLIWGLYAILRRSPRRWWLYGWLAMIPVLLLLVFIQPVFIDPLFDKFDPLEQRQPQLLTQLEKVMHRGGLSIDRSRMFEMRASDKVTTYNAYVTGIGASKRVVVWDNTAKDLSIPETMFVFGHEQGHYVLNHIWKGLFLGLGGLLIVFYLAYRLIGGIIRRWGRRWDVRDLADWASFPVLLLIFTVFSVLTQPVVSGATRYMEHEADIYGLEVIHGLVPDSQQVAARAFQKLGEKGLAFPDPNPLYVLWTYDHPTIADRLQFAAKYQPWNQGQQNRFIK
jgi:Zn-dependent protease with chaperone function